MIENRILSFLQKEGISRVIPTVDDIYNAAYAQKNVNLIKLSPVPRNSMLLKRREGMCRKTSEIPLYIEKA